MNYLKAASLTVLSNAIVAGNDRNAIYWLGRCEALGFLPSGNDGEYFAMAAYGCERYTAESRREVQIALNELINPKF